MQFAVLTGGSVVAWFAGTLAHADLLTRPAAGASHESVGDALDSDKLESFVNHFFAANMERLHVPGAAIVIVKDGTCVLARGYGFSNLESRTPVIAEQSLFEVHSVSKLFTMTAVMQAVEQGLVQLGDDVQRHLKSLQVPNTYPQPIRLHHLMTHTSGLEDQGVGIAARSESDRLPLGAWLAKSLPPRVSPPGSVLRYSDYGVCLAAYVIESAAGEPFAEFVERNVLGPLEMQHSYTSNVPSQRQHERATGYSFEGGQYVAPPHFESNIWPADGMIMSVTDMAPFMIAHLQDGRYESTRILTAESAQQMHHRQFSHHPRLPGICFDFFERFQNGERAIGHTGAGAGFVCELLLIPEQKMGYFLAANTAEGDLLDHFRDLFFDRCCPIAERSRLTPPPAERENTRPRELAGWYWFNRYDRRTLQRINSLVGGFVRVTEPAQGTVSVGSHEYVEISPYLFRAVDGDERHDLAFRKNEQGQVDFLFLEGAACERVPWLDSPPPQLGAIAGAAVLFASVCLVWPAVQLRRRSGHGEPASVCARVAWHGTCAVCIANLLVLASVAISLLRVVRPSVATEFQTGLPLTLSVTLALANAFALMSLAVPLVVLVAWAKHCGPLGLRVYVSVLAVACLTHVAFCHHWRLIGL